MTTTEALRAIKASPDKRIEVELSEQAAMSFPNDKFQSDVLDIILRKKKQAKAYLVIHWNDPCGIGIECFATDGYSRAWNGRIREHQLKFMHFKDKFDIEAMI